MEKKIDFEKRWDTELQALFDRMASPTDDLDAESLKFQMLLMFKTWGRLDILGEILGKTIPEKELLDAVRKGGASDEFLAKFDKL